MSTPSKLLSDLKARHRTIDADAVEMLYDLYNKKTPTKRAADIAKVSYHAAYRVYKTLANPDKKQKPYNPYSWSTINRYKEKWGPDKIDIVYTVTRLLKAKYNCNTVANVLDQAHVPEPRKLPGVGPNERTEIINTAKSLGWFSHSKIPNGWGYVTPSVLRFLNNAYGDTNARN